MRIQYFTMLAFSLAFNVTAQTATNAFRPELLFRPHGNFSNNIARPLRYWPVDGDFVITNGAEFFNRPLYCLNSGFRVDAGDKPEFSLYLPGRGGNLRIGIKSSAGTKWLNDAHQVVSRYHNGSIIYEINDPWLNGSELKLTVLPLSEMKGAIVCLEAEPGQTTGESKPVELFFAFGGASGARGARDGDIGCERQPVSEFFQMRPEQCRDNILTLSENAFTLRHGKATIAGVAPTGTKLFTSNAMNWNAPEALLASGVEKTDLPAVVGQFELPPNGVTYLVLRQLSDDGGNAPSGFDAADLPKIFSDASDHGRDLATRVVIDTPDPYINAAARALCVAADAVWDERQQCYMHGAVAWRTRLLGWRGQYAGDALGWHDRTAAHFASFAKQQNTNPVPDVIPPADEQFNLARSEAAIHSNGNLSRNHYDMNLVAVDAFFRHLLWTGDTNYAREMWPVIERHLAWERRLFRRVFGPEKLPLYEAYAAIWASDDLNYNGAGTAHASAYNYFANTMAARVAKSLGENPTPYENEARSILRGMNQYLWLPQEGNFAESKDYLGLQLAHPNSGLWTFYHTLDSQVPSPEQAWRMTRWIDTQIAHIPITGPDVPEENLFTVPETSWMPYQWSLNNVVMAEAAHTALGFWQANRPDAAFALFKGEILDSMFLGLCPGNVGCLTSHDMARGEAQRDFADAIGVNSRALIEGLFGVQPDALAGTLKITPGFPASWSYAGIDHPDFNFIFNRAGSAGSFSDAYIVTSRFPTPMQLVLQIGALGTSAEVTVNGKRASWEWMTNLFGVPRIEIQCPVAKTFKVDVNWKGEAPAERVPTELARIKKEDFETFDWTSGIPADQKMETVNLAPFFNDEVKQIFRNEYCSPRSPFASLATPKQGIGGWCEPNAAFDVDDSGLRTLAAKSSGQILLPNGIPFATPAAPGTRNIIFTSQWDNYPKAATVPLAGTSSHAFLLMAGSTGPLQSRFDNGEIVVAYEDGSTTKMPLRNPENWWPIDQDYFTDDFAFRREGPLPPRVDLATGKIRILKAAEFKGQGGKIPGGAATVLDLPLDQTKPLKSLTVRTLANEVVIGLMSITLER